MTKKCIMCSVPADYTIKNSNDYYCKECAAEHFSDVSFLQRIEEKAKELKQIIKKEIEEEIE